jgi:Coproporphyrinogen III oxidase and related Fe-S oxidoreductases
MADVNFGMYPQDKQVCEFLLESKKKYKWPLQIMATTGKNSKKRVMEITSILGNMFSVNMSLQSMSETVLKNIKRSNIRHQDMMAVNNHLRNAGRSTKAELILPLPGETKKSFIEGLNSVLESSASSITIYTLMMLEGTEFKNPGFRKKHEYKTKYRIIPLNFGEYNGEKTFDFEEVGIATKRNEF